MDKEMLQNCLRAAVIALDPKLARILIEQGADVRISNQNGQSLLHLLAICDTSGYQNKLEAQKEMAYVLCDYGIDIDAEDDLGCSALEIAAMRKNALMCDVLLQCGADMHLQTSTGETVLEKLSSWQIEDEYDSELEEVIDIFNRYSPGLWMAVVSGSIANVRRLTNLWCRADLVKDGKGLCEAALETGHEEIISLILGIQETMKLVHHVLAGNSEAVHNLVRESKSRLQLDIRNMSNQGAPILFYVIQKGDAKLTSLLVENECKVYTMMRDEEGVRRATVHWQNLYDLPVLFTAIRPNVKADIIDALLPKGKPYQEELLYKLLYKSKTVLEVAVEEMVSNDVLKIILDRGGPMLLASRNQFNQTPRDVAENRELDEYVEIMDKTVVEWILNPEVFLNRLKILALWGYDGIKDFHSHNEIIDAFSTKYLKHLDAYQMQIKMLSMAAESGNMETFRRMSEWNFDSDGDIFERNLAWHGRPKGDGLPLLHRAVLHNQTHIVEHILGCKPPVISVDTLLDQYHRTALHYCYGQPDSDDVRALLLNHGASEHTLDKNGCEPLDFRIKQGSPKMEDLLDRMRKNEYSRAEPDPWSAEESESAEAAPASAAAAKDFSFWRPSPHHHSSPGCMGGVYNHVGCVSHNHNTYYRYREDQEDQRYYDQESWKCCIF